MKVPLVDLSAIHAPLRAELDAAMARVLDTSRFVGGPELVAFEAEVSRAVGVAHTVGVSSGTDALLVSLMALGVGAGDEVVTTPFSFFATAGVIARLGARPVFADIDPRTFNLDPRAAEAACTSRTKAVIPVHLYGRPAELPDVNVPIVEDAAQSIGASTVSGALACVSFFPTKNLGAFGDGGAVLTDDGELADTVRTLRQHGARTKYFHETVGGNFRLDALQAAVLRVKLPHLTSWNATRRSNADRYRALAREIGLPEQVKLPDDAPGHIYNQFVIRAPRRDALREHLSEAGVSTLVYYPRPFHQQACFAELGYAAGAFPHAERAADEVLALPIAPGISPDQQAYVIEQISSFYAR